MHELGDVPVPDNLRYLYRLLFEFFWPICIWFPSVFVGVCDGKQDVIIVAAIVDRSADTIV